MFKTKICYKKVLKTEFDPGGQRSVSYKGKTWDVGQKVSIGFINGTEIEKTVVRQVYKEISEFVNLNFVFSSDLERTDIRWSFNKGNGSWSYVGTDASFIPKNIPTANVGWEVDKGVVRHEAGHSLGIAHEHQNPNSTINWDRDKVIEYLSGAPNYWSVAQIEHNVLNPIDPKIVNATNFDPDSVMLYFFPASWTLDGKGTKMNTEFSLLDIEHYKEIYPNTGIETDGGDSEDGEVVEPILLEEILLDIFDEEKRLYKLTEDQLIIVANYIGIEGIIKEDLKKDTISKIWSKIKK